MKKKDLPQDKSALENFTREVVYVKNEDGKFEKALSSGWDAKKVALDNAWEEIERRTEEARKQVKNAEISPIAYFLEKQLMDLPVLVGYTGYPKWRIKKHMKPNNFNKLSDKKLKRYADAFDISVEDLKNFKG